MPYAPSSPGLVLTPLDRPRRAQRRARRGVNPQPLLQDRLGVLTDRGRTIIARRLKGGTERQARAGNLRAGWEPRCAKELPRCELRAVQDLAGSIQRRERSEEHTSELQSLTNLVCR